MTAWLPPEAKSAFDAVLVASQAADRGVAVARTDAERRRQEADRERDQLLSAAQATARELVTGANVNTANIVALEREETPQTRSSLLLREYRADMGNIMGRVGSATLIDPQSGTRLVLPGK
jgi:regulator of protease activity HflC (stomatin/prohibitin superfamily)